MKWTRAIKFSVAPHAARTRKAEKRRKVGGLNAGHGLGGRSAQRYLWRQMVDRHLAVFTARLRQICLNRFRDLRGERDDRASFLACNMGQVNSAPHRSRDFHHHRNFQHLFGNSESQLFEAAVMNEDDRKTERSRQRP